MKIWSLLKIIIIILIELTSRCTDCSIVARIWDDEEGLDEGAQGVDNVSEYLGGVLLHVV